MPGTSITALPRPVSSAWPIFASAIRVPVSHAAEVGGVIWVSLSPPASAPPAVTGTPLRSMTFDAAPDFAAHGFALSGATATGTLGGTAVTLLLQPAPAGRLTLHALAATSDPATLAAVSQALEAMRRQAEEALA